MSRCLYCYRELEKGEKLFHPSCAKKFFGDTRIPDFDYSPKDMDSLALQLIQAQTTLTGVQPKISLHIAEHEGHKRFTIVGLWGDYIFKPQTDMYELLPENEDLTMHLAELAGLATVPHSLIQLSDGSLGYLTRRIDRNNQGEKSRMEDFCQLTGRMTEHKYIASHEQVAKTLAQLSSVPDLDLILYYQEVIFCYITGNNDMHLKNFSLYEDPHHEIRLTPAYDLVNAHIVNPGDREELALTLNGKKSNIKGPDFLLAASRSGVPEAAVRRIVAGFQAAYPTMKQMIQDSFLNNRLKVAYQTLLERRLSRL